jgi:hypothetical protein
MKGSCLLPVASKTVVDDQAEHLVRLYARLRQMLRQRRREGTVGAVAIGGYGPLFR